MNRGDADAEILEIEAHAWRVWLENGDAIVCLRCGNAFVPAGERRGREDGEAGLESNETGQEYGETVQEAHEVGQQSHETTRECHETVDLCGSCLPLRLLEYGDKRARRPECVVCGGPVRGRRSHSLYCGDSCKKAAYRKRKNANHETAQDDDESANVGGDIGNERKGGQTALEGGSAT